MILQKKLQWRQIQAARFGHFWKTAWKLLTVVNFRFIVGKKIAVVIKIASLQ